MYGAPLCDTNSLFSFLIFQIVSKLTAFLFQTVTCFHYIIKRL